MKYSTKKNRLDKGILVNDRTMSEVARRLSKTARKQVEPAPRNKRFAMT